ncbi:hypothetical protein F5141DRAFT_1069108 [Pisolithus sp. B1]|nr:hypothetical protein F5141DRAFT_1069108 [Pisolithus sp. B1]
MPHACKECGLEFDNRNLHDAHWKKCVKVITSVAYTGQDVTITHHENGTFLCCSHHKCPRDIGFTTVDALHKHMKTLKTTWLGPEKKASWWTVFSPSSQCSAVPMEITTDAPSPPQMPAAIPQDETMMTPSAASNGDAPMHSPPTAFDMSGQVEESAMSPRSPPAMEGPSIMSLVHAAPATSAGQARVDNAPFIHHPYLDSLDLVVNAEFCFLVCQLCKEGIAATAGQAHLVNKHPELLPTFDQECFQGITSELQVMTSLLMTIAGPRPKVHGLAEFDALACDHCGSIYMTLKSIRKHHGTEHKQVPAPQHWWSCRAQRMKPEGAGGWCANFGRSLWKLERGNTPEKRGISKHAISQAHAPGTLKQYIHPIVCLVNNVVVRLWFLKGANMEIMRLDDILQEDGIDQCQIVAQIHLILLKVWTTPWSKSKFHIVPDPTDTMSLPHIWWTDRCGREDGGHLGEQGAQGPQLRVDSKQILDDPSEKSDFPKAASDLTLKGCSSKRAATDWSHQELPLPTMPVSKTEHTWSGSGEWPGRIFQISPRQEDGLVWNQAALCGWLQDYAEMQKLLLMCAEMLSGAPSRGSELTAMIYHKHPGQRHLQPDSVWQAPHPARSILQDDCSHQLRQDLALACPFAEIAAKICFGKDEEVTQLYCDHLFINFNKAFTSDNLSAVMAKHSLPQGLSSGWWWHTPALQWESAARMPTCNTQLVWEGGQDTPLVTHN